MSSAAQRLRIGVFGASGYAGAELVRLLEGHPFAEIAFLTGNRTAGQAMASIYPHLARTALPDLIRIEDADFDAADMVFCCLPHGTTQKVMGDILGSKAGAKVVDLSPDFRLRNPADYKLWYGAEHQAPALQGQAVYGLTEFYRDEIATARLVANPGCYATTAELALLPPLVDGVIAAENIVVDAKSGVSGAGRAVKLSSLHSEVSESLVAYKIASHRHTGEIEQELGAAAGRPVTVSFTPHLAPMNRGILATCYVTLNDGASVADLRDSLAARYDAEPFVHVAAEGVSPATHDVRGSNHCIVSVFPDRRPGHAIILSVIDNLVKGASGQAVQNMNVMAGFEETLALEQGPLFL
ncbi:MAG: N-acetyl-gamma-glutamyl-phosphate reductase [Alphaproteobacteria bacterium]|nr:N-acetyl-gamma-glutamyl-phosphate reductase [Alphaproteobacteria bacterium]